MKTLDEVIKEQERCNTYPNCHFCYLHSGSICSWIRDALHYLKKLQDFYKICNTGGVLEPEPRSAEIGSGVEIKWHEPNPALTWDELKTMEGKPVWVESHGDITEFTEWAIVRNALEDRVHFIFSHYDGKFLLTYEMAFPDVTFGKEWNVYRKER